MIKITATDGPAPDGAQPAVAEIVLVDEGNRPTAALLALAALELTFDCLVGYAAYRYFKARKR